MMPREPQMPWQEPYEPDEDYQERIDEYAKRWDDYNIACDMAVDRQREKEANDDE
jgi:hypothetical protein